MPESMSSCGRDERAGGDDDLAIGEDRALLAVFVAVGDANRPRVHNIDPLHARVQPYLKARVVLQRRDEGLRGAASLPTPVHELIDAALAPPVEVAVVRLPQGLH